MKITVTMLNSSQIFVLDVNGDLEIENVKALCEFESGITAKEIVLLWNGAPLTDMKKTLNSYGIKEGEILLLQKLIAPANTQTQQSRRPAASSGKTTNNKRSTF